MATTFTAQQQLNAGSVITYLTTELNSLANGSNKLGGALTYNSGSKPLAILLELYIAALGGNVATNGSVYCWPLATIDSTNYDDGSDSVTPAKSPIVIPFRSGISTAQRRIQRIWVPPGSAIKLLFQNNLGQALASSGNTAKILEAELLSYSP